MNLKDIKIKWLGHDSFLIEITKEKKYIYIDPFKIPKNSKKADIILITHIHYDHFSIKDIKNILKKDTIILCTKDVGEKLVNIKESINLKIIFPNQEIKLNDLVIKTIPAYNLNKIFHLKKENWVGYIIELKNKKIYHAGDTDLIPEMRELSNENIDIALLPISGTYVMDIQEALEAAKVIKPKLVIPMHYGEIIGDKTTAKKFEELCSNKNINIKILEKQE